MFGREFGCHESPGTARGSVTGIYSAGQLQQIMKQQDSSAQMRQSIISEIQNQCRQAATNDDVIENYKQLSETKREEREREEYLRWLDNLHQRVYKSPPLLQLQEGESNNNISCSIVSQATNAGSQIIARVTSSSDIKTYKFGLVAEDISGNSVHAMSQMSVACFSDREAEVTVLLSKEDVDRTLKLIVMQDEREVQRYPLSRFQTNAAKTLKKTRPPKPIKKGCQHNVTHSQDERPCVQNFSQPHTAQIQQQVNAQQQQLQMWSQLKKEKNATSHIRTCMRNSERKHLLDILNQANDQTCDQVQPSVPNQHYEQIVPSQVFQPEEQSADNCSFDAYSTRQNTAIHITENAEPCEPLQPEPKRTQKQILRDEQRRATVQIMNEIHTVPYSVCTPVPQLSPSPCKRCFQKQIQKSDKAHQNKSEFSIPSKQITLHMLTQPVIDQSQTPQHNIEKEVVQRTLQQPIESLHEEKLDDIPEFLDFGVPPPEDEEVSPVSIKYQPIDLAAEEKEEQIIAVSQKVVPKFAFKPVAIKKISLNANKK